MNPQLFGSFNRDAVKKFLNEKTICMVDVCMETMSGLSPTIDLSVMDQSGQ